MAIYTRDQKIERYERVTEAMRSETVGVAKGFGVDLEMVSRQAQLVFNLSKEFGPEQLFWVGFYDARVGELKKGASAGQPFMAVGVYRGTHGCPIIAKDSGVCGYAWRKEETIIVPDTHKWKSPDGVGGHIACSDASLSEIVVPIFRGSEFLGVFDADSTRKGSYDETDKEHLDGLILDFIVP